MKLRFKLNEKEMGLNAIFGELEAKIMEILWEMGPLKGKIIHQEITKEKKLAYTTILTVLDRLSKKGFIEKIQKPHSIIFIPTVKKEEFKKFLVKQLINSAVNISNELAISTFADTFSKIDPKELEKISKLIKDKLNEKK